VVSIDIHMDERTVNPAYYSMFSSRSRELVVYGGAGAGKSYAAAQKIILKALSYPGSKIAVIRKYGPALKLTCMDLIEGMLDRHEIPYTPNRSDREFKVGESTILFLPVVNSKGDPAERLKSLTDLTDIWIEEPTELTFEEYTQVKLRLRGEELEEGYRQIILTFNPINKTHWLYSYFFEGDRGERQKYTYKDNRFIDEPYKEFLESLKDVDEYTYNVYCLGEWGVLGELIFTNYEIKEFLFSPGEYEIVLCGVDFGYEHPSAWVLMGLKGKTAQLVDEVHRRKKTNPEFIELIQEKQTEYKLERPPTICDSAEPGRIEEMKRSGINAHPALKNVIDGIDAVKGYKLIIHPRCLNVIAEIRGYSRKKSKAGEVLEEPIKANDHTMDALRYGIYTYEMSKSEPVQSTVEYYDPVVISPY